MGTFYTDTTGAFSVTSLENMWVYVEGYEYDTGPCFAKPCPEFKDDTIIEGYEEVFSTPIPAESGFQLMSPHTLT